MFKGPREDLALIRERMETYCDAVNRGDEEAYLACWHDDGLRIGQGVEAHGKEALRAQWRELRSMMVSMAMFAQPGTIEVDGDRASARFYCHEVITLSDGRLWKVAGLYEDAFVRCDGEWRFARREYSLLANEKSPRKA
jgi:uncharacterized protein (TIGR02246 family)